MVTPTAPRLAAALALLAVPVTLAVNVAFWRKKCFCKESPIIGRPMMAVSLSR